MHAAHLGYMKHSCHNTASSWRLLKVLSLSIFTFIVTVHDAKFYFHFIVVCFFTIFVYAQAALYSGLPIWKGGPFWCFKFYTNQSVVVLISEVPVFELPMFRK